MRRTQASRALAATVLEMPCFRSHRREQPRPCVRKVVMLGPSVPESAFHVGATAERRRFQELVPFTRSSRLTPQPS
jgi:hypothetical protein